MPDREAPRNRKWPSVAYLVLLVSLATATWVFTLLIYGTHLAHCPYLVAVKHHPGVFTCSDHPRPTNGR